MNWTDSLMYLASANVRPLATAATLATTLFAIDLMVSLGIADGILYTVLVLAALWMPWRQAPFILAGLGTILAIAGHLLAPPDGALWMGQGNPVLAIGMIWAAAYLVHRRSTFDAELRATRDALTYQLRQLEAIYAHAPVGLCYLDRELRFVHVNERLAAINGFPVEAHLGRRLHDLLPELAAHMEPVIRRVIETGKPVLELELHGAAPGQPSVLRDWLVSYYPLADETGRVLGVNAVIQEITELIPAVGSSDRLLLSASDCAASIGPSRVIQVGIKRAAAEARHLSLHDPLTGLPNRVLLLDRLGQVMAHARREGSAAATMLLDLDGFKDVNDTLGHPAGDRLLQSIAGRIASVIRGSDTLARLGGDEFALVQPGVHQAADAVTLADKVLGAFAAPFELDGQKTHMAASLGIALFPRDGQDPDTLLKNADLALYRAKAEGRGRFRLFEPAMDETAQARRRLERELRQGLERDELVLHYQPQLKLATGRFTGVEALVRWNHPERGLVLPGEFIPLAESTGLIRQLGDWVLREACRQARTWRERGWRLAVAVNVSPVQLRNGQLLPAIGDALKRAGLEPARLELEITEGVLVETLERELDGLLRREGNTGAGDILRELTARGVRLAIDDFGVGYSSLSYLKHLPVQTIKIDRSFLRGVSKDPHDTALLRGIVALGRGLGKRLVAEGVEDERQLALLHELGCDEAQGFYIARPQAAADLEHLLRAA
jgi:diguanylate cyclase (GGDEF)-like protein/PAS domain S-box-containing protein